MRSTPILLAVFLGLSMLTSCSEKKEKKESPVLQAYRLIDEQRTDEAIALLEDRLVTEPENLEYKVTLASAYAHKGGFKIQKLVPAVGHAEKLEKLGDKLHAFKKPNTLSAQADAAAMSVATLLNRFARLFDLYESIPVATPKQAIYLRHAIHLLNELGARIKPEDALYRAVLEIILLKHLLAENLVGEMVAVPQAAGETCRLDLGHINDSVVTIGKLLIDILNDFAAANPAQAKDMKNRSDEISQAVSDATVFLTSTALADEATQVFLKQAAIQTGFGKMIKCAGL